MTARTTHAEHDRLMGMQVKAYSWRLHRVVPGIITDTTTGAVHVSPTFAQDVTIEDWTALRDICSPYPITFDAVPR